jgi:uncharacterized protein (DUF2062 family)
MSFLITFFCIVIYSFYTFVLTMPLNKTKDLLRSVFKKGALNRIKKEIFNPEESNARKAISIGFGVFMGIFPVWGFQMIIAVLLSLPFRLNKVLVLLSTNISLPPLIPFIIYFSYKFGSLYAGQNAVQILFNDTISLEMIHLNLMQYLIGAIFLSIISGLFLGIISYILLLIFGKRKKHQI